MVCCIDEILFLDKARKTIATLQEQTNFPNMTKKASELNLNIDQLRSIISILLKMMTAPLTLSI